MSQEKMQDILVVVDMQNDFITGPLGSVEAEEIIPSVAKRIAAFRGRVYFTKDTHEEDYLDTQEGKMLPILHCLRGSEGWMLCDALGEDRRRLVIEKGCLGSIALGQRLIEENRREPIRSVTLIGLCTDMCVISNALILKACLPEAEIRVDASCCAGASEKGHQTALDAMKTCQVIIENEG